MVAVEETLDLGVELDDWLVEVGRGLEDVEGGGCQVEVGVTLCVVGLGGGGGGGGAPLPSVNSHSPYMIPAPWFAKNEKSPGLRSSPPYGHPGHVSWTVAVVLLPP